MLALQGMAGRCLNPPSHHISQMCSLSPSDNVSAAWSCLCRELLLCAQVSALSVLTERQPHPFHCVLSSALQSPPGSRELPRGHLSLYKGEGAAQITPKEKGHLRAFSRVQK